jgi:SAM-dependent methyltransferase
MLNTKYKLDLGLCGLVDPRKYKDREWLRMHLELERFSFDKHVFYSNGNIYRKGYEWTQIAHGLDKLGLLGKNYSALGVGAGRECLIYWLTTKVGRVVATDLYGNQVWSANGGKEADEQVIKNPKSFCPIDYDESKLIFMNMDGTNLDFGDNSFEIIWSASSIEHFGSHKNASLAMKEMARVVKPGGVVAIATEFLILEEYKHNEYFSKRDLEKFVIGASDDLELVEPVSYELPAIEYLVDSVKIPEGAGRQRRHVVLNDGKVQWTSIVLFFRKVKR